MYNMYYTVINQYQRISYSNVLSIVIYDSAHVVNETCNWHTTMFDDFNFVSTSNAV